MPTSTATMLRPRPSTAARPGRSPGQLASPDAPATGQRALWLDAFRGFTMLCLISRGFGFPRLAEEPWAKPIARQFEHVDWAGMTAWDLIQPFFMFVVGAAMPFAFANRAAKTGADGWAAGLPRVIQRCLLLILWSHVIGIGQTGKWGPELINVLAQIGLAYPIAYCLLPARWPMQLAAAVGLLVLHYVMHVAWPGIGPGGPWAQVHNFGEHLDRMWMGRNWSGHYATINFVTSATALIAGIMAANLLRGPATFGRKAAILVGVGALLIGLGVGLDLAGVVPVIKRIWTPSFALVSVGITLLALLAFYAVGTAWPRVPWGVFIVIGANPIFLYLVQQMFGGQIRKIVGNLASAPANYYWSLRGWGKPDELVMLVVTDWLALGVLVFAAYWLYRRKIFLKL